MKVELSVIKRKLVIFKVVLVNNHNQTLELESDSKETLMDRINAHLRNNYTIKELFSEEVEQVKEIL